MGDTTPMREEMLGIPELPARVAQERHPVEQCRNDVVSRAEVVRILRELGATHADLAIYGEADSARNRESAEAAFTLARCAVALMPPAFTPANTAAVAAQLDEAAEWLADDIPAGTPEIEHLEGDVRLDELDLYCVNVMRRASAALRAKDAEIAALKGATAWRPMSEAPKDGTAILATVRVFKAGEFSHHDTHVIYADDETGEVQYECEAGWAWDDYEFWLPLPDAPVGAERDHEGGK
ncbi:hypothetical protein [Phenylobacterium immobile]|uniref:hypothetical protein n=1 Tax=Phenylobacterium immobile TaxID=21 RepID=UPI000A5EB736|nr:hypothetical protein [Phenylobacterium immobile]